MSFGDDGDLLCGYSTVGFILEMGGVGCPYWTVTMTVNGFVDDDGTIDHLGEIFDSQEIFRQASLESRQLSQGIF